MERLTKTEEPIMQIIWRLNKVFVKDIIEELPEPKPPYNTISSIVRILEEKGMVGHEAFGRTHQYFPIVSQSAYRKGLIALITSDYFGGSYSQLLSHIVSDQPIPPNEVEELKQIIKNNI